MKWDAEFRAADRQLGLLLSGKMGGEFVGEVAPAAWAQLRVQIVNAFNTVVSSVTQSMADFTDLPLISEGVTAEISTYMQSVGISGIVRIDFATLDPASAKQVEERRASGPVIPDAFVLGATGKAATVPPGTHVNVQWDDGNLYPATVVRSADEQYLLTFADGRHLWVDGKCIIKP